MQNACKTHVLGLVEYPCPDLVIERLWISRPSPLSPSESRFRFPPDVGACQFSSSLLTAFSAQDVSACQPPLLLQGLRRTSLEGVQILRVPVCNSSYRSCFQPCYFPFCSHYYMTQYMYTGLSSTLCFFRIGIYHCCDKGLDVGSKSCRVCRRGYFGQVR